MVGHDRSSDVSALRDVHPSVRSRPWHYAGGRWVEATRTSGSGCRPCLGNPAFGSTKVACGWARPMSLVAHRSSISLPVPRRRAQAIDRRGTVENRRYSSRTEGAATRVISPPNAGPRQARALERWIELQSAPKSEFLVGMEPATATPEFEWPQVLQYPTPRTMAYHTRLATA